MHDSCVVVSLLKAIPIVLRVKILVISEVAKGLAPWASVWCGGEWANAYPVIALRGGSYSLYLVYHVVAAGVAAIAYILSEFFTLALASRLEASVSRCEDAAKGL